MKRWNVLWLLVFVFAWGAVGCIEISSRLGEGRDGLSQGVVPNPPKPPSESTVPDASTSPTKDTAPTKPSPPPVPDTSSSGSLPACTKFQTDTCKTDADCPTDRPFCSDGRIKRCFKCKAYTNLDGSTSSCKPPSLWADYTQYHCKQFKKYPKALVAEPCEPCGGGNTRYVFQVCVAETCTAP